MTSNGQRYDDTPFIDCRIVVGVDGSPMSIRALVWAAAEAANTNCRST